eukprot:GGOE01004646.1.p1 GENE.GGOE01004646.1~~GGOE01004646.1.p1  ORF type:complete len:562 (+),score=93.04 GGOE01004646.1:48-1733(+)
MTCWANAWDLEKVFSQIAGNPIVPGQALAKVELRKVWNALSSCIADALQRRKGALVPFFGTFTLFKREIRDHGAWTSHIVHELLFHLNPTFESTYHMITNEASQASNQGRLSAAVPALKLPLSILQEKTGLSRSVVSDALRDTFRFIGEGVFRGLCFVLEFPLVARVFLKNNKCRAVFMESLVNAIVRGDAARVSTPLRKMFPDHPNQEDTLRLTGPLHKVEVTATSSDAPTPVVHSAMPAEAATRAAPAPRPPRSASANARQPTPHRAPRSASCGRSTEGLPRRTEPFRLGSPRAGLLFEEVQPRAAIIPKAPVGTGALRGRALVRKGQRAQPTLTESATQTSMGPPAEQDPPGCLVGLRSVPLKSAVTVAAQTEDDEDVRNLIPLPPAALHSETPSPAGVDAAPPRAVTTTMAHTNAQPPTQLSQKKTSESHAASTTPGGEPVVAADVGVVATPKPPVAVTAEVPFPPFVRDESAERLRKRELALEIERDNLERSAAKKAALEELRRQERERALERLRSQCRSVPSPSKLLRDEEATHDDEAEDRRAWLHSIGAPRQVA